MRGQRSTAAAVTGLMGLVLVIAMGCASEPGPTNGPSVGGTRTTGTQQPVPFVVPTSSWRPGQPGEMALLQGTLRRRGDCLVVGQGRGTLVIWPAGFTGRRLPDGPVQVLNPEGQLAIAVGDEVSLGGGAGPLPTEWASCRAADAFSVQQELP